MGPELHGAATHLARHPLLGLGCASCHGAQAQGERGPTLAGGRGVEDFRGVHGKGLFPASLVSDQDFQALDAWLKTLKPVAGGGEG